MAIHRRCLQMGNRRGGGALAISPCEWAWRVQSAGADVPPSDRPTDRPTRNREGGRSGVGGTGCVYIQAARESATISRAGTAHSVRSQTLKKVGGEQRGGGRRPKEKKGRTARADHGLDSSQSFRTLTAGHSTHSTARARASLKVEAAAAAAERRKAGQLALHIGRGARLLVRARLERERAPRRVDLRRLALQEAADGAPQQGVAAVVRAVRVIRQVAPLQLVLALRARLDARQGARDRLVDGLVVAELKVEALELSVGDAAPVFGFKVGLNWVWVGRAAVVCWRVLARAAGCGVDCEPLASKQKGGGHRQKKQGRAGGEQPEKALLLTSCGRTARASRSG